MTDLEVENQSMTVIYATSAMYATGQLNRAKTKTGQIHTVQKCIKNHPRTLRGRDKWLFVFLGMKSGQKVMFVGKN